MNDDNRPSRECLDAYIDGQLPPEEMTRISALLANYHDLQAYVAQQQSLQNHLHAAFSPVLTQPIPERLQEAVRHTPISLLYKLASSMGEWRSWLSQGSVWRPALPAAAAVALGLVVGIAIDRPFEEQSLLVRSSSTGGMIAQGELAHALNQQLAADDNHASAANVGLSFRSKSGEDCRTFSIGGVATSTSGIACRTGDSWVVAALASSPHRPGPVSPYQMAGSTMPDLIRKAVNDMIAGGPFDSAAERAARARHWQGNR